MKRNTVLVPAIVVVLLALGLGTGALADEGMLSIECDGSSAETRFIADQGGTETRDGWRIITTEGGYVVYRIPVGTCIAEEIYYSINQTSYSLEFSPDGRSWSPMVRQPLPYELPYLFRRSSNGFVPEWQKAAKETGTAYVRFSRLPGGKAPLCLEAIHLRATGISLPKGFHTPPKDFERSWYEPLNKSLWTPITTALKAITLVVCLVGVLMLVFSRRARACVRNMNGWSAAVGVWFFLGLVLYSIVHEAGHVLTGWVLGGRPDWRACRWTLFSGENPSAAFRQLPNDAIPWMTAGGEIVPTITGLVLVFIWFWRGGRMSWWWQIVLLIPGFSLLLPNVALLFDSTHTLGLAAHLGLGGSAAWLFACSPAFVSLIVCALIARRLKPLAKLLSKARPFGSGSAFPSGISNPRA